MIIIMLDIDITVFIALEFLIALIHQLIYANLVVHDGGYKPSENECINGLKALQDAWDLECNSYRSKRRSEYPTMGDQLDDLYKKGAFSDEMAAKIKAVKDKYPKS